MGDAHDVARGAKDLKRSREVKTERDGKEVRTERDGKEVKSERDGNTLRHGLGELLCVEDAWHGG